VRSGPATAAVTASSSVVREASMLPTQGRWSRQYARTDDDDDDRPGYGGQFGSSSRGGYRSQSFFDRLFGDDDEFARSRETFRTVCVRVCDGYYFPISFSATREHFERDRQVCENSCGSQARLFVYRNPGGSIEDMRDLQGKAYKDLRTAFLYRTQYVADCKCRPHPWEQQALDQHRLYALAEAKRKGDKTAAAEFSALEASLRQASAKPGKSSNKTAGLTDRLSDARPTAAAIAKLPRADREVEALRLGWEDRDRRPPRSQFDPRRPQSVREWEWSKHRSWGGGY
jgi:Protein of unknown function (DUF2865)